MGTVKSTKPSKRDKNKRLLGAWVEKELFDTVKAEAARRGHKNSSTIVIEVLTEYFKRNRA